MRDMSKITQEEFDNILFEMVNESPASHLLTIPGVYEPISEEFNNAAIERWEAMQDHDED